MNAVAKMRQAGFIPGISPAGGLTIEPASKLTPDQRAYIRAHKAELLAELLAERATPEPAPVEPLIVEPIQPAPVADIESAAERLAIMDCDGIPLPHVLAGAFNRLCNMELTIHPASVIVEPPIVYAVETMPVDPPIPIPAIPLVTAPTATFTMWRAVFSDNHTATIREPEPVTLGDILRYAAGLTGIARIDTLTGCPA